MDTHLKNVDIAMFKGKSKGRNNCQFYTPSINASALKWLTMENELRKSIEERESVLFYQPKLDIQPEKIIGVEALVQWRKPNGELISPKNFIPLAEEAGLIISLGEWVLRTACRDTRGLHQAGFGPLNMAVNLSSPQFKKEGLIEVIKGVIKATRIDPRCLELEITESMIMQDSEPIITFYTA